MQIFAVSVLALLAAAATGACVRDWDCALNGICDTPTGLCKCDVPWTGGPGGDCTALNMLPAPISSCGPACAYHGNTTDLAGHAINSSTWGARVVRAADGTFRMAVNEYQYGCGLNTWRSNSQIAWTSSPTAVGPFSKLGVAVDAWATNPTVFAVPSTGELVVVTCGAGYPCALGAASSPSNNSACNNGVQCACVGPPAGHCHYVQPSVNATARFHFASSLQGADSGPFPWAPLNVTMVNFTLGNWIPDLVNPSPLLLKNGTTLLMVHSAGTGSGAPVIMRSVAGGDAGWRGPYEVMVTAQDKRWNGSTSGTEDPFLWQDGRGNFHALYHHLGGGYLGRHAWSADGYTWSDVVPCYNNSFLLSDGTLLEPTANGGAQRPALLQDPTSMAPTHLFLAGATCSAASHPTCQAGPYTMVVPLALQ